MKREDLPDDINELKDIIEIQLAEIEALRKKHKLFSNPYHVSISFKNNKPRPFNLG